MTFALPAGRRRPREYLGGLGGGCSRNNGRVRREVTDNETSLTGDKQGCTVDERTREIDAILTPALTVSGTRRICNAHMRKACM